MMETGLQLISFRNDQMTSLLGNLNIQTEKRGNREAVLNEVGQVAKCKVCERELFTDNIGKITHGSVDIVCDNPACIVCHLVSKNN